MIYRSLIEFNFFSIELPDILGNPTVSDIAKKHNRTAAQVLLRHLIQNGICAIPKSTNPARLKQNIDIFGFELDQEDMKKMNELDQGGKARILDFGAFKGYVIKLLQYLCFSFLKQSLEQFTIQKYF